jgi:hypothetical protein
MKRAFLSGAALALLLHFGVAALTLSGSNKEAKPTPQQTNSTKAASVQLQTNLIRLPGKPRYTNAPPLAAASQTTVAPAAASPAQAEPLKPQDLLAQTSQTDVSGPPNPAATASRPDADRPLRLASPESGTTGRTPPTATEPARQIPISPVQGNKTTRITAAGAGTKSPQRDRVLEGIQAPALQIELRPQDVTTILAGGKGVLAAEQQIGSETFYHRFNGNWKNPGFDPWTSKARARFSNRGLELPSSWFDRLTQAAAATLGSRPAFFTLFLDAPTDAAILQVQLEALQLAGITNQSQYPHFTTAGQLTCSDNNIRYTVNALR